MTGRRCLDKAMQLTLSLKYHLILVATVLFAKGILSENGWLIMVSSVTGLREITNLVSMKLGVNMSDGETPDSAEPKKAVKK